MLSGDGAKADWVKNARRLPEVKVGIRDQSYRGQARVVESGTEDALARALLLKKYQPRYNGDLTSWSRSALPVAVDLFA